MIPTLLESGILAFFILNFSSFGNRNFEGLKKKKFSKLHRK
nr:MAG TPA: hypothetical protein [Caudoviricetes sp.]